MNLALARSQITSRQGPRKQLTVITWVEITTESLVPAVSRGPATAGEARAAARATATSMVFISTIPKRYGSGTGPIRRLNGADPRTRGVAPPINDGGGGTRFESPAGVRNLIRSLPPYSESYL